MKARHTFSTEFMTVTQSYLVSLPIPSLRSFSWEHYTRGKKDGKHQDTHQGQSNGQSHNPRQVFNFLVGLFIYLSLSRIQLKYCFDGQTSIPDEGSFHFCRLTVTPSYIMLVIDQWIDLFRLFTVSTKYNTIILS